MTRKLFVTLSVAAMALVGVITAAPASAHHGLPGWGNYTTDWVSVADRTTPWPIDSATQTWDNGLDGNRINLTYRWWDCASANGCIMVWEDPNIGPYYGVTQAQYDGSGQYRGANIRLNTPLANTAQQKLKTSCHEIGHAMGLNEHPGGPAGFTGSCMVQGASPPIVTYPDWHDFEVVNGKN